MKFGDRFLWSLAIISASAAFLVWRRDLGVANKTISVQVETTSSEAKALLDTPVSTKPMPVAELKATPPDEVTKQVEILNEILVSGNDNDPRIDSELMKLGPEAKQRFREIYQTLAPERRNDRGTIVFLLGRNLTEPSDFSFLKDVLAEEVCFSLEDCKVPHEIGPGEEEKAESEMSLNYPQATVLEAVERYIDENETIDSVTRDQIQAILEQGAGSPVIMISRNSENLMKKL